MRLTGFYIGQFWAEVLLTRNEIYPDIFIPTNILTEIILLEKRILG